MVSLPIWCFVETILNIVLLTLEIKISLSQNTYSLSAYCKADSILFSILCVVNSSFFEGAWACRPIPQCLGRIISKQRESPKLALMSCTVQNGSA